MLSNSDSLKRYLLHLPANSSFSFTNDSKRDIRKALFWAISGQGQFLDWIFPMAFKGGADLSEVVSRIEEFNWSFSEYCKSSLAQQSREGCSQLSTKHIHNHHAFHENSPCARIFRKGEPIYRCLTCGFDDNCALCSHCYHPQYHEGHKVHITICQRENGGVCDCGDPEAWVNQYTCPYAKSVEDEETAATTPEVKATPIDLQKSFLETIEILLDYVIDVMSQCELQFDNPQDIELSRIHNATFRSSLNSSKYGYSESIGEEALDRNSEKFYLMVYNDQIRHYRDAVQRIYLASKKVPQFAEMITEKVQNFGKAKVISSKDINLLRERQRTLASTGLATCIRSHRDIFREDMCHEILTWIYDLTESEMFKSNNDLKNLFCRAFCGKWNNGLLHYSQVADPSYIYKVGTLDPSLRIPKIPSCRSQAGNLETTETLQKSAAHWSFTPSKWQLPQSMCEECEYNLTDIDYQPDTSHVGSRFQYFIYLDVRFWKSIRILLHDMFSTSLITNLDYKYIICCQYVDIYPAIADMFLTMDREPELSVMCTLSTQLFTCPTNSTSIVEHGDLSRIFASIYGFLTVEEIGSPQSIESTHSISMKSLKNRRWGQIFFDIGYILSRSKDSKSILASNIVPMACDILALFQGRPVMKRESKNHIEYENPDYSAFFHAISVIYQFADHIASCLCYLGDISRGEQMEISRNVIRYVVKFLLRLENAEYPGLIDDSVDIKLSKDQLTMFEKSEGGIIQNYGIDKEKVSFLHPIHSFLSWLIELSEFESPNTIKDVFGDAIREFSMYSDDTYITMNSSLQLRDIEVGTNYATSIFEYPIRTIVLMSQIKSGFWVRNGFSVRSQLQLYRNTGLRESGYMRDLFLTQVFINTNNPNLVCFLLFNRWLLMDGWINKKSSTGEDIEPSYDQKTLPYMIEECLSFFIHVLTEDLYLRGLSSEKISELRVRCEIIHNLCFGPTNYTKLCSQIPDHISSEKKFDLILEEMATFVSPVGSNDIGVYKLKEKYFETLNPYYFNYTTNTKDDAIKLAKERIHKKTGKPKSEIVVVPTIRKASELGVYKFIGNFSISIYFQKFLLTTLEYITKEGIEKADSLLETILHLIHICSFEETIDTATFGTFYDVFIGRPEGMNQSIVASLYHILTNDAFKDHHAKIMAIYKVLENKYHTLYEELKREVPNFSFANLEVDNSQSSEENEIDRKKRLAKERQEKLMAKFKKQQSSFLRKNSIDNGDCSDIDMDEYDDDVGWKFPESHCLLCQNAAEDAGPFGIITHVSKSSEFRVVPFDDQYWFLKSFSDGVSLDVDEKTTPQDIYTEKWKTYMSDIKESNVVGPGFPNQHVDSKLVSSSCGHGMHFQCYLNYLNSSRSRASQITRNTPENVEHKEFLCPLCKSINNMFIPILWNCNKSSLSKFLKAPENSLISEYGSFGLLTREKLRDTDWFNEFVEGAKLDITSASNLTAGALEMIQKTSLASESTTNQQYFQVLLSDMFQTLASLTFPYIFKADSVIVLVNSIKSAEIGLRGLSSNGGIVINQLSNNSLINLRTLNEFRNTSLYIKSNYAATNNRQRELYVKLLANLMFLNEDSFNQSVLQQDFFELLVNMFPLPTCGFSFNIILKMCFLGHVFQTFNTISTQIARHGYYDNGKYSILDVPIFSGISDEIAALSMSLFRRITKHDHLLNNLEVGKVIFSMVVKACTPFLRRAAIYAFVSCADVENYFTEYENEVCEVNKLCTFLGIDTLEQLFLKFKFESNVESIKLRSFVEYMEQPKAQNSIELDKALEYPGIVRLVDLPERLDFFFTKYYYSDIYETPHRRIENPAICLFCGDVLDVQKSAKSGREGQCTTHFMKECANNVGIYLLPKERCLLLMHKNGGSFYNAPFLDQHGELPSESKRGKTLYLMDKRYDDFIRNVWLQHDIPNYITRKLDSVMDAGGWDTL
ncbi:hypothetical protein CAAN1_02S01794 [[Candida] anglica]|uniref:E3 ubiquitin-protein ligase n=1 Tax=[Candida] anglica TaxID=148631 RepID=A0ABP0E6I7_9ASCO